MANRARCKNCGDVIESKSGHDWVCCSCFRDYDTNGGHGIYLDGGGNYYRCGGNFDDFEYVHKDSNNDGVYYE